jgi:hypothetical protein
MRIEGSGFAMGPVSRLVARPAAELLRQRLAALTLMRSGTCRAVRSP